MCSENCIGHGESSTAPVVALLSKSISACNLCLSAQSPQAARHHTRILLALTPQSPLSTRYNRGLAAKICVGPRSFKHASYFAAAHAQLQCCVLLPALVCRARLHIEPESSQRTLPDTLGAYTAAQIWLVVGAITATSIQNSTVYYLQLCSSHCCSSSICSSHCCYPSVLTGETQKIGFDRVG